MGHFLKRFDESFAGDGTAPTEQSLELGQSTEGLEAFIVKVVMVDVEVLELVEVGYLFDELVGFLLVLYLEIHAKVLQVGQHIDVLQGGGVVEVFAGVDFQVDQRSEGPDAVSLDLVALS